ncbi:glutamate decarboxylase [Ferroacidibacillus organovorans]|uniref:Glutamate decarboxylase n=1 Tax=Ferroacidibacillus organovorans TaxID=1765683 RepID=A0A101XT40_9BACL|nr:glutamate decarboxylase [Ferroacidibacillus organovorans]KUO97072.1 glutamate decarboxylase [Ferroacidibacillus organovorans]
MWTVIYIAHTLRLAEQIQSRLTTEGFLVKLRAANGLQQQYEILVPETELEDVRDTLREILHSSLLG